MALTFIIFRIVTLTLKNHLIKSFKLEMKNSLRDFEIKQKLGSGSYGVIFKAINKKDKSTCVLKQINLARLSERAKKNVTHILKLGCHGSHNYGQAKASIYCKLH